mmetsp:Transcript_52316/g.111174  ORF Transcript_52316/g.111174 Transcript_52316/m.111174 type:complete len:369 (-) Transcript_52316:423-1529(-)
MGRVSRYKKVKSIDPFAKNGSWKSDVGDCATLRRAKRKSKTALRLKEQKNSKLQRRMRAKKGCDRRNSGGSNGWGDDDGYDLPPEGGDEFDLNDLMGSVKKQTQTCNPLLETTGPAQLAMSSSSGGERWTCKVEKVDQRGVVAASNRNSADSTAQSSKKQSMCAGSCKEKATNDNSLTITAKTTTREIIEACSNPKSQKSISNRLSLSSGLSKQEKRKAFLKKKRSKKRRRGSGVLNDDDGDDFANREALKSLHSQPHMSSEHREQAKPKKHLSKQQNYSDTLVARTAMDDQVERPPTFTSLPRGANKLSKNRKSNCSNTSAEGSIEDKGEGEKDQRIRKEQQALESMREQVMKQYAMLRRSRRNGAM